MITEEQKNEHEILSADEQKVREMCLSLKRVEAPKDFDFKLKARIANSQPSDFAPRFGFAFRYALPALAMIFVLSFLAYNSGIFSSSNNNQVIAESSPETTNPTLPKNTLVADFSTPEKNERSNVNSAVLPSSQNLPKLPENEVAESKPKNSKFEKNRKVENDNSNRSEDKSLKKTPIIIPPKFEQKSPLQNPQNTEKVNPISVKEVLSINGIKADFENGKWTVKSVTANSLGESSGVKENDVIEAIDNQPLSAETVFNKTVNGKIITVLRNGEKSQIKLRNKQ